MAKIERTATARLPATMEALGDGGLKEDSTVAEPARALGRDTPVGSRYLRLTVDPDLVKRSPNGLHAMGRRRSQAPENGEDLLHHIGQYRVHGWSTVCGEFHSGLAGVTVPHP